PAPKSLPTPKLPDQEYCFWASLAVSAPERENQRPPRNDTNRFRTATCSGRHVLTTSLPGLFNPEERNAAPALTGLWAWIFDWSPNAGRSRKSKKPAEAGFSCGQCDFLSCDVLSGPSSLMPSTSCAAVRA